MKTFVYSGASLHELGTCHADLQQVFHEVIKWWDTTIIIGHRGEAAQNEAFRTSASTKQWPDSKHNVEPSLAVDAGPWYPGEGIPWDDPERFRAWGGFVLGVAAMLGVSLRYGGDWDGDRIFTDQRLMDLGHFEKVMA